MVHVVLVYAVKGSEMHALGDWECPNRVDCILHDRCWIKARTGAEACAPYYGPPNYKLPAIIYKVERNKHRTMIIHFNDIGGYWVLDWMGKHESARMQAMHAGRLHVRSSDEME